MSADGMVPPAELERLRFAALIQSSDDAIVSKDLDGTIRSWNPAAERIFGYTADEMVGDTIFRVIPPELHPEERDLLARIRAGEHIAHYETDRVRKDGRRIRISLTLSPLLDREGRLIGASAIKRDVTAHRALELQLQQAQKLEAVGRLAGGIAHDFNNLLTVISGLSILLRPHLPEGGKPRENLDQVIKAAERASALTQQLLTFSRRQVAEIELLDPAMVARGMESLLRPLLGEHIVMTVAAGPHTGLVRVNRVQLEQVVMNLAINARDAMPQGGRLTIDIDNRRFATIPSDARAQLTAGEYVVLRVRDTGTGMDSATRANIFEPFFTTKAAGRGTGLGLATVYAVVQQAGGTITVDSEPGAGSVFTVYLPLVDRSSAPPPANGESEPKPAEPGTPSRATVLLVEDEFGVRSLAAQVLESAGYRVLEAVSGEAALGIASGLSGSLDLVITDVVMEGINGRVLAERLRAWYPDVRVLFMSGYTDDMVVRAGIDAGGSAFLQKPFTPKVLLEHVAAALGHRPHAANGG